MSTPTRIDGAIVLATASVDPAQATGRTRHFAAGELANGHIRQLAVARYEEESGVYLFYCDGTWAVITDTFHDDVESALAQARFEFEFGDLKFSYSNAGQ